MCGGVAVRIPQRTDVGDFGVFRRRQGRPPPRSHRDAFVGTNREAVRSRLREEDLVSVQPTVTVPVWERFDIGGRWINEYMVMFHLPKMCGIMSTESGLDVNF